MSHLDPIINTLEQAVHQKPVLDTSLVKPPVKWPKRIVALFLACATLWLVLVIGELLDLARIDLPLFASEHGVGVLAGCAWMVVLSWLWE